ncbi:tRNA (adenosine(37)-N6)-threonylcarbamoyltransferase complex ATPase subunit type 1 TsaE [Odoribacter sp. OttesenSCG-928-A06]|nr:tRNA (adenosine(37)-N6)-threonylcarbamoyltransferase complex ATPase subunit type 1 TsaE [Odoribacter sp. OttesenSCG-928-A06]
MKFIIDDLSDIDHVAARFMEYVGDKHIFALYGSMGVGKTTFVKAIARYMGVEDDVNSPTFSIVNEYTTVSGDVFYHFDFYRINQISEALDFGYEEYFYSRRKCFIEWPEKIEELLPEDTVYCYFSELNNGRREIRVGDQE